MAEHGDLAGRVAERTRLAHLNELAHEVSRTVRHTLECVGRLLSTTTDTEPSALLVSSLRRLSDCLERVFDSFANTTTPQHDSHLNCAERQQQRALSEGLLRRMKELILQGAGIIQAAQQQQPVAEAEALERGFKGVVQRFVVDLREIIRLQHVIAEPADDQQHGGPFADGNHSGPSALPSRTTTDVAADVRSVTSSVSHGASPTGRPPVPSHQPGSALEEKNVWLRAGTPTDGETGEPKTHLTHALAARRLMSLGRRASHEAGLGGGSTSTTADAAGDVGDEGAGSPLTVHPYRRSRIVYGFKVKEGAMKLKVELQTEEAEGEGEGEMEGRPWEGGGDEVPQPREAGRWSSGGGDGGGPKEELSDEQFVSMMLNFFGEMERRKAALANTPPAARRNPHPPPDAPRTPPAAAQQVPEGGGGAPVAEHHASTPSDEREPNEEGKARKIPHLPPPAQQQHEGGDGDGGSGTSPTRQQQLQQLKKKAVAENEGGGSRQGSRAKEGRWYKCILS